MARVSMSTVWKMRRLVTEGYSIKEIAEECKTSTSTVRSYTKSEMAKVANKRVMNEAFREERETRQEQAVQMEMLQA